ncbi:nitroreductase family protein, partial [Pseudomonas aeruginosa]
MDFEQLVTSRHSAVNFVEDFKMTEEDFKRIFELTKTAPSAYNLQYTNYLVVTDADKKEQLRELSFNQYKLHTASGVV